MLYQHYLEKLDYKNMPIFLIKYLKTPSLIRLKKVGYFCGMDYASKDIYDFPRYISRFDHSLTVSLLTYKLTKNKQATIAGLFHDIATPCFSHVIDYMNKDYEKQESTEEYTEQILNNDKYLIECLKKDNIGINDIINFKKYSIVDNERPKICADRLDGIILTGAYWIKNVTSKDIDEIIYNIKLYINEYNEYEIGLQNKKVAERILEINKQIDEYCHSNEDNYMMELLAQITKYLIDNNYITYNDLYILNEEEVIHIITKINDITLQEMFYKFKNIKKEDIPATELTNIKIRTLNPFVKVKRLKSI